MKLKKTRIILNDIRVNAGIESWYKKTLIGMVVNLKSDINHIIVNQFKPQAKSEKIAMDSATNSFTTAINLFKERWNSRLNKFAEEASQELIERTERNYHYNLNNQLINNGLSITFSISDFQKSQYEAVIRENISLIHSISQRYLTNVESIVYQCVTTGYDLSKLSETLQKQYMIDKRRANNIARDQSNKAHAIIEQAKRQELGIKKAIWRHSNKGKEPRQSHINANGKEFDVAKGMYIDGEYILPAMKINCRCTSRSVIEF